MKNVSNNFEIMYNLITFTIFYSEFSKNLLTRKHKTSSPFNRNSESVV